MRHKLIAKSLMEQKVGVRIERVIPLYERTGNGKPLVYQLSRQGHRWVAKFRGDNC